MIVAGKYTGKRQCKKCGSLTFHESQVGACGPRERCCSCGYSIWAQGPLVVNMDLAMDGGRR